MVTADILTEVRRRTQRGTADVTFVELESALTFLTLAIPTLYKECTTPTIAGRAYYDLQSLPKKFKQLTAVNCTGGDSDVVLEKIDSWKDYQSAIIDETTADYDQPSRYVVYNDYIYVYPTPDTADYTLTLFAKVFEDDSDSILLPDVYREPIYELTCFEVYKNLGLGTSDMAKSHFENYLRWQNAFNKLEAEKIEADSVQYNDL